MSDSSAIPCFGGIEHCCVAIYLSNHKNMFDISIISSIWNDTGQCITSAPKTAASPKHLYAKIACHHTRTFKLNVSSTGCTCARQSKAISWVISIMIPVLLNIPKGYGFLTQPSSDMAAIKKISNELYIPFARYSHCTSLGTPWRRELLPHCANRQGTRCLWRATSHL